MTRKQAWRRIARAYERRAATELPEGLAKAGFCNAIHYLRAHGLISTLVRQQMRDETEDAVWADYSGPYLYSNYFGAERAGLRAIMAQTFAEY